MSWLDSEYEVQKWLDDGAKHLEELHQYWADRDEAKFLARMDKKPELNYGPEFIDKEILIPPFIIEPFFPDGGICLLHGPGGVGKTMLAMSMTHAICTGSEFLGEFPTNQGTVVYIQLDMVDNVYQDRLRSAGEFYKFDSWYILTGVASVGTALQNTPWVMDVNAAQPSLIIIDTLRKAHSWNENDNDTPGRFYTKCRELFGYTAVMVLHHDRKSSEDNIGMADQAFRGAGAWKDDIDCALHLTKKSRDGGLRLEWSKVRTCEESALPAMSLKIDPETLTVIPDSNNMSKMEIVRGQAREYLKDNPDADRPKLYAWLTALGNPKARASIVAAEYFTK